MHIQEWRGGHRGAGVNMCELLKMLTSSQEPTQGAAGAGQGGWCPSDVVQGGQVVGIGLLCAGAANADECAHSTPGQSKPSCVLAQCGSVAKLLWQCCKAARKPGNSTGLPRQRSRTQPHHSAGKAGGSSSAPRRAVSAARGSKRGAQGGAGAPAWAARVWCLTTLGRGAARHALSRSCRTAPLQRLPNRARA
jgi:hypothetical protein